MTRRKIKNPERFRDDYEERSGSRRKRARDPADAPSENPKAPILLRVLAWGGVILLCFVAGYMGTSYMLRLLDKQILLGNDDPNVRALVSPDVPAPAEPGAKIDMQKTTLSLFYPRNGNLMEEKADFIARTREDNMLEAVHKLLELSGLFGKEVYLKHVFRNVDTVYLDFSGAFVPALSAAGSQASTLFITGIVRTMRDNFSPVAKVRFLVDSKLTRAGAPVDLTATWQLPR